MNDKQIRRILIEYLKATNTEIRIYQEKHIGSSVCDLMAVTDCLTGYEIKSDLDNYTRLHAQVHAYDAFFDRNYIVVGESHRKSVCDRIPEHWGVIVIRSDGVAVERQAQDNSGYMLKRKNQLSILWRLELRNILTKSNMPLYIYKDKGYIAGKIAKKLEDDTLKEYIVYELMHRDYSVYNAKDYTEYFVNDSLDFDGAQNLATREIVDSLSEKNLEQFTLDQWIALYRQAKEVQQNKQIIYQKKPDERTPHEILYTDIEVSPGVPWVSREIIEEFIFYLCSGDKINLYRSGRQVNYEPVTGNWFITDKQYHDNNERERLCYTYGLPDYNALHIFEATLNLREINALTIKINMMKQKPLWHLKSKRLSLRFFANGYGRMRTGVGRLRKRITSCSGRIKRNTMTAQRLYFPI